MYSNTEILVRDKYAGKTDFPAIACQYYWQTFQSMNNKSIILTPSITGSIECTAWYRRSRDWCENLPQFNVWLHDLYIIGKNIWKVVQIVE